jgi:hypothetical protein
VVPAVTVVLEAAEAAVGKEGGRQHHSSGLRAARDRGHLARLPVDHDLRHLKRERPALRQRARIDRAVHDDVGVRRRLRRVGGDTAPRTRGIDGVVEPGACIGQKRQAAALAFWQAVRARGKRAARADIAAAGHVDDATLREDDRGAVIFGHNRGAGVAAVLAEIEGAQADAAAIDVKRTGDRVAEKTGIVDPATADIDERMGADHQIGQRRRSDPCRHAGDRDAAAMRDERAVDSGRRGELDAAAVQHR